MSRHVLKQMIGYGLIVDVILLDQFSKWYVLEYILKPHALPGAKSLPLIDWITAAPARLPPFRIEVLPFFDLSMVWNQGVSFGFMQMGGPTILIGIALIISVFFAGWILKAETWGQAISLGMVVGGAMGNVIDRLRFGAVADFLDFHAYGWHYPAFNVADTCITLGIAFLVLDGVLLEPRRKKVQ